jgi:ubiquinone/menaquinone biosynthesis C-methylase UbiE
MNEDEFAKSLLAHERREWQDPEKIIAQIDVEIGMAVADLACGPGFFTVPLSRAVGESGRIYAVDSSELMLDYLQSNLERSNTRSKNVSIYKSDVSKTGIPPATCDVVLFANILHDLDRPNEFIDEVKRISKENALIVDIDWKDVDNGFGPPLDIRLSETKAKEILKKGGLVLVRNIDPGPYHYGLVLKVH